ncbi:putative disease resistance protein RGA4 [Iris pallida]|uniref:Disease resistance protein RGA4 n=1 Tax=Iris pallida TaxID=29817 RepID=A0AAX6DJ16_IRIPA|nr:putative disease resistance protein RGA4 [Iris pallida]
MVPLAPFASVMNVLGPLVKDEIVFLMGVQDEIELLLSRLERMQGVLAAAERLPDRATDRWRLQLTDVMYDSDDIVDECTIEGRKLARDPRRPPPSSSWPTARSLLNFFHSPLSCLGNCVFRHEIGNRIAGVTARLDQILRDVPALYLTAPSPHERRAESSVSPTTSPLVEPDLVGLKIEEDTRSLVDLLVGKDDRISVFAIVGMPGIGKTTLAQKIVNDERLRAEFDCISPIWVYVSRVFSETDLLRAVIARAGGSPGDARDRVDLEPMLNNVVKNKKLFLVLDDVWDARVWVGLLDKPLRSALAGSRVLVTTRQQAVAMGMDAVHYHRVERLSNEDGWSLLCKMVLNMDTPVQQEALRDTGMRIVEKCNGLPLALKTTAGVLRTREKRRSEWEKVLENPAWSGTEHPEDVMGAFYMSYDELPSHLKKCFVYFSLFPEDTELYQSDFVDLWIAEGFVQAKGERLMEEVAEEYWKELIHRSLLQPVPKWYKMSGCKMHDLLHTLARNLSGGECFCDDMTRINAMISNGFPGSVKPRRLHITSGEDEVMSEAIREQRSLRTLMLRDVSNCTEDTIKNLSCLRVLEIRRSSIERLPVSIDKLIHLRYLSVSQSPIREIPESIGNLQVLQYFILKKCKNLHNLPDSITSLRNLRCIDLSRTRIHNIPAGIERLKLLTKLSGFVVSSGNDSESYCTLKELSSLSQLKSLSVYNLEKATSKAEASTVALRTKSRLTRLELHCTPPSSSSRSARVVHYEREAAERITEVFEELCPPRCLETLRIRGYFGLDYPTWMMNDLPSSLPSLTRLELEKCDFCERLPPLGLLDQFDYLVVRGASAVENIGPELFVADGISSRADPGGSGRAIRPLSCFPKLTNLAFENMPNWAEWWWLSEEEDDRMTVVLPCLKLLEIKRCPKLRSLPEGLLRHATALTVVRIEGARSLKEIKNLRFVVELVLYDSPSLERVRDLPALRTLWLRGCGDLREVENIDALRHLHLKDLEMGSLPEWLLTAGREVKFRELRKLYITGKKRLLTRCLEDGLDWHMIRHVPSVEAHTLDESAYIYYTKSPLSFVTNMPDDADNND